MGVKIDTLKCTGCEACVYVCPVGVLFVEDMKCRVNEGCISCGLCVDLCQWRAITLEDKPVNKKRKRGVQEGRSPSSLKPPPLRRRRGRHRG